MENTNNEALELKNAIDASIETKAAEVAKNSADALEAKANELTEQLTKSNENVELLQKQIDELKANNIETTEVKGMKSIAEQLEEKGIAALKLDKNAVIKLDLKNESDYTPSAGADSAPYRDDRQTEIEYAPHQSALSGYLKQVTGTGGAYRLSTKTGGASGVAGKAKGGALGQTTKSVSDRHVPYITVGHILTVPREELDDTTQLQAYFQEEMMEEIVDTINAQVIGGTGASNNQLEGITQWSTAKVAGTGANGWDTFFGGLADSIDGANEIDVLNSACASLKRLNFDGKKYAFVNPELIAKIQGLKATDGHYQLNSAVDPTGKVRNFLGGIELIESPAVGADDFYAFDVRALKFVMREGMSLEVGYTGDDWERNNVSLKAIMRCNVVSGNPTGIVNGTFALAAASLETP